MHEIDESVLLPYLYQLKQDIRGYNFPANVGKILSDNFKHRYTGFRFEMLNEDKNISRIRSLPSVQQYRQHRVTASENSQKFVLWLQIGGNKLTCLVLALINYFIIKQIYYQTPT